MSKQGWVWLGIASTTLALTACGGHESSRKSYGSAVAPATSGTGSTGTGSTGTGTGPSTGSGVTAQLEVVSGPENQGQLFTRAPAAGVVVAQVRLRANADVTLDRLVLITDGTVDESRGLGDIVIYQDSNSNGARDAGEPQLGTGQSVGANNGSVAFAGLGAAVTAAAPVDLLVAVEVTAAANVADTVSLRVAGYQLSAVETGTSAPVPVVGGATGGVLQVIGGDPPKTISVTNAPGAPTGSLSVAADATDVVVNAVRITTTTGDIDVHGVTLHCSGSGDDLADVETVTLIQDNNRDGRIDAGDTTLGATRPSEDDGRVTYAFHGRRLYNGSGIDLLVAVTLSGTADAGDTFAFALKPAGLLAHNYYGNGGTDVTFTATNPASISVNATATALVARAKNAPAAVVAGTTETLALALELRTGAGTAGFNGLTVAARGSVDDASDVTAVSLYADTDGDGAFSAADTLLAGPSTFSVDDGTLTLRPAAAVPLATASSTTVLVTATLAGGLTPGQTFELSVDPASGVNAAGATVTGDTQFGTLLVTGSGTSAVVQPDADLGKDAFLRGEGLYKNDNFGNQGLAVGDRPSGQLGERVSYVEMPFPTLPAGATPQKAYVALYLSGTGSFTGPSLDVQVFRVIDSGARTPWIEGRGGLDASLDGICFDSATQTTTRTDLTQPDASPTVLDEVRIGVGTEGRWVVFDVTSAAQAWYAGTAPNHGLRFRDKDHRNHDDGAAGFHSSDSRTAALRPIFLIEY